MSASILACRDWPVLDPSVALSCACLGSHCNSQSCCSPLQLPVALAHFLLPPSLLSFVAIHSTNRCCSLDYSRLVSFVSPNDRPYSHSHLPLSLSPPAPMRSSITPAASSARCVARAWTLTHSGSASCAVLLMWTHRPKRQSCATSARTRFPGTALASYSAFPLFFLQHAPFRGPFPQYLYPCIKS